MKQNINDLVKPAEKNQNALTLRETSFLGVDQYWCATFIEKKNILVKGERTNRDLWKRNASILLFDLETGRVVGGQRL